MVVIGGQPPAWQGACMTSAVAVQWEHVDLTQSERIQREYRDRAAAEAAVERLREAGFAEGVVSMTSHGGTTTQDGTFLPGRDYVVVPVDALRAREESRSL